MAANRHIVKNFYELRAGLEGMREFATAGLAFMDENGMATGASRRPYTRASGNGTPPEALRERVKRHYTARRSSGRQAEFPVTPPAPAYASKLEQQRAATAALLAQLDTLEARRPTSGNMRAIGSLVRRGYVKKANGGYIRTGKEFSVSKTQAPSKTTPPESTNGSGGMMTVSEVARVLQVTDTTVRNLIKNKELKAKKERRPRHGRAKPVPTIVIHQDEVSRYMNAAAAEAAASGG